MAVAPLIAALLFGVVFYPIRTKIDKTRVYRIGYGSSPPLHFQAKTGVPAGLAVGIVREAARRRGIRLEWVQATQQGIPALQQGDTDFWVLMTDLPERHKIIHLTEPYLVTEYCFLVPSASPLNAVADLANARIAFPGTQMGQMSLAKLLPHAVRLPAKTPSQAWESMIDGRAEAVFMDQYSAAGVLLQGGSMQQARIVTAPLPRSNLALASSLATGNVADEIRDEIGIMSRQGALTPLVQDWGFFPGLNIEAIDSLSSAHRRERMLTAGVATLLFLLLMTIALFVLSRRQQARLAATESALRASEEYYRTLVDVLPDTIYTIGRDGEVGPRLAARQGHRDTETALKDLIDSPGHQANLRRVLATGQIAVAEEATPQGTFIEYRLIPVRDHRSRIFGVMGVLRDETDKKRAEAERFELEERLRQAQRMETLGRLAGGVAHDFNNLLTVIKGYSAMVLRKLGDHPLRAPIEQIAKAGDQAADLTSQLLAFSRKQIIAPTNVSLNDLVEDSSKLIERLIGENIEFASVLSPGLHPVLADAGQMRQVLLNFASNARDAMPQGGRFVIETSNLQAPGGPQVLLTASDTGVGMDRETSRRVFEPFFTTKSEGNGTGLGLATVHGIVHQAGGTIQVYSEPGQGTTFRVYLPAAPGVVAEAVPEIPAPGLHGAETILVTEDKEEVLNYAVEVLESYGYRVLVAGSGEEARRVSTHFDGIIHLLLTDVVIGGMNGRQLAEKLCEQRAGIQILYMSGYTDDIVFRQGLIRAETNYLSKPFTPEALAQQVREILNRNSQSPMI